MYVVEFLSVTIARMQSTAYCRSKNSPTDIFLEELRKKKFSKISKIPKKYLQKSSFSLTLQACNPELLTSVKKDPKKNVFFECFKIVCHKRV